MSSVLPNWQILEQLALLEIMIIFLEPEVLMNFWLPNAAPQRQSSFLAKQWMSGHLVSQFTVLFLMSSHSRTLRVLLFWKRYRLCRKFSFQILNLILALSLRVRDWSLMAWRDSWLECLTRTLPRGTLWTRWRRMSGSTMACLRWLLRWSITGFQPFHLRLRVAVGGLRRRCFDL